MSIAHLNLMRTRARVNHQRVRASSITDSSTSLSQVARHDHDPHSPQRQGSPQGSYCFNHRNQSTIVGTGLVIMSETL